MEKSVEKGQEINIKFKNNKGVYPNSKEALEKDLIDPEVKVQADDDEDEVDQEWKAREDQNQ
jgi:hypothetical protein